MRTMEYFKMSSSKRHRSSLMFSGIFTRVTSLCLFNPILPGGGILPLMFFLHNPKTAQGIKLKLPDFKDTPLRHIFQVKPARYILTCYHGNKITKGTLQNLAPKKSEKSAICKIIELEFDIETKFGPLSSKTNINLQFEVIMTFLAFRPFC